MRNEAFRNPTFDEEKYLISIKHLKTSTNDKILPTYHYHNCLEIIIILKGNIEGVFNNMIQEIHSNSLIVIGKDLPHKIISHSHDAEGILIHIPYALLIQNCELSHEMDSELNYIHHSKYGFIYNSPKLTKSISSLCRKINKNNGFQKLSLIFQLLDTISSAKERENLTTSPPYSNNSDSLSSIDRTFQYLYDNFTKNTTLKDVAGYANQNPTALCKAFKKASGFTIFQFLNKLRIEKACKLLTSTNLEITTIAYNVGYSTFSHFHTQFKLYIGISPKKYRMKILHK